MERGPRRSSSGATRESNHSAVSLLPMRRPADVRNLALLSSCAGMPTLRFERAVFHSSRHAPTACTEFLRTRLRFFALIKNSTLLFSSDSALFAKTLGGGVHPARSRWPRPIDLKVE